MSLDQQIRKLQAERSIKLQKLDGLADLERTGVSLSVVQLAEFDKLEAETKDVSTQIAKLERQERVAAANARPIGSFGGGTFSYSAGESGKANKFAAFVVAAAHGGRDSNAAASFAEQMGMPDVAASLSTINPVGGGYIVPKDYLPEVIEYLHAESTVRAIGASRVAMPHGNLTLPKVTKGTNAGYIGELEDVPMTEPEFGELELKAKKLAAFVPISNDLIRRANPSALAIVQQDLMGSLAAREDLAFLRGDGLNNTPAGLRTLTNASNVFAASGSGAAADISADLSRMDMKIMSAGVKLRGRVGYIMHPRTFAHLSELRTASGERVYPEVSEKQQLKGRPIALSFQIPMNLGVGGNESEIYFGVFDLAVIGDATGVLVSVSDTAAYKDGSGNLQAAFTRDESVIKVVTEHDFGLRQSKAFVVLTGVKWGYVA